MDLVININEFISETKFYEPEGSEQPKRELKFVQDGVKAIDLSRKLC